jgi:hypothetical protein
MSSTRYAEILLDAQLIVLLAVGTASRAYVAIHKRLQAYDLGDFDAVLRLLRPPTRLIVTPNVLSEASNLIGHIAEPARTRIYEAFRGLIGDAAERYVPSSIAAAHAAFIRVGLSDAACLVGDASAATLVTADLPLYLEAARSGRRAISFRQMREIGW